jgi:SH3-like domain-containing protein
MADTHSMRYVRATRDYRAQYADPIEGESGTTVLVTREDDEYRGWWWCTAPDGRSGWVPADILDPAPVPGGTAEFRRFYSARELTVSRGDTLVVEEERSGWLFVRTTAGERGWVPESHAESA